MKESLPFTTLLSFPLLSSLPPEDLEWLQNRLFLQSVVKDEVLLIEGEMTPRLYFVLDGWLKVEKTSSEGRQQTIRYVGPGEVLNELVVFSQSINPATIQAMEEAHLFYLTKDDIDTLIGRNWDFSRAVIASLSIRIQHLLDLVESLSLYSVDQRLAQYMLEESIHNGFIRQSWKTQTEIAARLGTVLDVVNRNLQNFARLGLIELQRDRITIIDRQGLEDIASQ
jgi:CRP/FNR family transcriptional regulator